MSNGIANAGSPAVTGVERLSGDADGAESAAQSFTDFLNEDGDNKPDPQSRPARRANAEKRAQEAEGDGADEGEGQSRERSPKGRSEGRQDRAEPTDDPLHDPILDGAPEGDPEDADDEGENDGERDDANEDDGEGEDDADPEFDVQIEGVNQKIKLSELQASYTRETEHRQRSEALAETEQEVANFGQALQERRQRADSIIQVFEDLINATMPSQAEWDALEQSNPNAFIAAQKQWSGFIQKMQEAKAHRDGEAKTVEEERGRNYNRYVQQENEKLFGLLPQLKNPEVQKKFSAAIFAYGKKAGYSPEEMARGLVNHRDILTAYRAAKYVEIQESRAANKRQNQRKGPRQSEGNSNPRPVQTARGQQASRNAQRLKNADKELQRTGSVQSAGNAFAAMFRD